MLLAVELVQHAQLQCMSSWYASFQLKQCSGASKYHLWQYNCFADNINHLFWLVCVLAEAEYALFVVCRGFTYGWDVYW